MFALDSAVVIPEKMLSSHEGLITYPTYHHGETIKFKTYFDEIKKSDSILTDRQSQRNNTRRATLGSVKDKHQALIHR